MHKLIELSSDSFLLPTHNEQTVHCSVLAAEWPSDVLVFAAYWRGETQKGFFMWC
jgi:hypothetical protein